MDNRNKNTCPQQDDVQLVCERARYVLARSGIMTMLDYNFLCPYTLGPCGQGFSSWQKFSDQVAEFSNRNSSLCFFEDNTASSTYSYCDCPNCRTFKNWVAELLRGRNIGDITEDFLMRYIPLLQKGRV